MDVNRYFYQHFVRGIVNWRLLLHLQRTEHRIPRNLFTNWLSLDPYRAVVLDRLFYKIQELRDKGYCYQFLLSTDSFGSIEHYRCHLVRVASNGRVLFFDINDKWIPLN